MNENNDLELGIAELHYREDGSAESAHFTPTMVIDLDENLLGRLALVPGSSDIGAIQDKARMVFATWFNKTNEIELADPGEGRVIDEILECTKYANGLPQKCVIKFFYRRHNP